MDRGDAEAVESGGGSKVDGQWRAQGNLVGRVSFDSCIREQVDERDDGHFFALYTLLSVFTNENDQERMDLLAKEDHSSPSSSPSINLASLRLRKYSWVASMSICKFSPEKMLGRLLNWTGTRWSVTRSYRKMARTGRRRSRSTNRVSEPPNVRSRKGKGVLSLSLSHTHTLYTHSSHLERPDLIPRVRPWRLGLPLRLPLLPQLLAPQGKEPTAEDGPCLCPVLVLGAGILHRD
jgi:hypothetical protein